MCTYFASTSMITLFILLSNWEQYLIDAKYGKMGWVSDTAKR